MSEETYNNRKGARDLFQDQEALELDALYTYTLLKL